MPNEYMIRGITGQRAAVKPLEGIIEGYPIVFNQRTQIGNYFFEEIDPHALDEADLSDIKFLINHNDGMLPVARHRRGKRSTMDISVDDKGMKIVARLDIEKNATASELCSAVSREDITDMSFCFGITVSGEEWNDLDKEMPTRRITKISKVVEISAVNDGAYPQTSIYARSTDALDNDKCALDNARAVALDNEKREQEKANLTFEKQKFIYLEEQKYYEP
jgi:HK97 family phage prohead protease